VIGTVRVDLAAARRLLCWYGAYALIAPRLPAPTCPLRRLTGRRCPACGLTTAVSAALHGRVRHAATLHRLGPFTAAAVLAAGVTTVAGAVRRAGSARDGGPHPGPVAASSGAGTETADCGRAS
jgi:Protein of unknown function (DUF2752)